VRALLLAGVSLLFNLTAFAQDKPKPAYDFSWTREERIKLAESAARPKFPARLPSMFSNAGATLKFVTAKTGSLVLWTARHL
jgi:hypothetical protein